MARDEVQLTPNEVIAVEELESVSNNTDIIKDNSWAISWLLHNRTATTDPTTWDDSWDGYTVWSRWINITDDKEFVCLDATATAAVWTETTWWGWGSSSFNGINWQTIIVNGDISSIEWPVWRLTAFAAWTFASLEFSTVWRTSWTLTLSLYVNGSSVATGTITSATSATNSVYYWSVTYTSSFSDQDVIEIYVSDTGTWSVDLVCNIQ